MVMYMNAHTALEQLRQKAEADVSRGPRVNVIATVVLSSALCYLSNS